MEMNTQKHDQKYWVVDGHIVTASFSKRPNPKLFSQISDILLKEAASHHCREDDPCIKIGGVHLDK